MSEQLKEKQIGQRTRICKECGKKFWDEHYINMCRKCFGKAKKTDMEKYARQNHRLKERWMGKIGTIQTTLSAEPKWDNDYFETRSKEQCAYCGEHHYKKDTYYHQFRQKIVVLGLPIHDIKELLEDFQRENDSKKTTIKCFLDKRGLEIKEIKKDMEVKE